MEKEQPVDMTVSVQSGMTASSAYDLEDLAAEIREIDNRAVDFLEKQFSVSIDIVRANADLIGSAWADSAECDLENTRDKAVSLMGRIVDNLVAHLENTVVDPEARARAALIRSAHQAAAVVASSED
jgi:hypothetical protein